MQDKDFGMRLKRAECPVKVAEIVEKTNKGRLSPLLSFRGSTVFSGPA